MRPYDATLVLGPTGSGKTPLGDYIATRGLCGRRCVHFDFGENLRTARAYGAHPPHLESADIDTVARVLDEGALLEDHQFRVALGIFHLFAKRAALAADDLVILNGIPRHAGQAVDIATILRVSRIVVLRCTPDVVRERIRLNTGGDRAERADDSAPAIQRKLEIFDSRTQPLIAYYRDRDVEIHPVDVGVDTQPLEIYENLVTAG
ncbi:MAG: nucleoside monophosphate kinase [Verrucomicrobia bacterium]|nr:nucleoside monophosphate kinase [Verrucomicrobiota bacterium]MDA1088393.1 nucleoside monophosphate kinase [Verrucomicrobiota bacterium]